MRKAGLNIMMSLKGDGKPVSFIEDCAVPLEHLADYTDALTEVFARHGTRGTWYAHASVGTLHVRPILDMRRDGAAKMRAIAEEASALVRKFKGAYSGEHGDGLCRGEWIALAVRPGDRRRLPRDQAAARPDRPVQPRTRSSIRRRWTTRALFRFRRRPYRTIAAEAGARLVGVERAERSGHRSRPRAPGSGGDPTGGFAKAVEMCNNNGHCRKFDAGTMCPSYRVTRDEQHLTRGRANTLRLALSGQLGRRRVRALASDAVHEALDLCVGCKGCKRDCPTGVDMARMKIEFHGAAQGARTAHSLKDRCIAPPAATTRARREPRAVAAEPAQPGRPGCVASASAGSASSAQRTLPAWRRDTFWRGRADARARERATIAARRGAKAGGALRRHLQRQLRDRERGRRGARAAGRRLHACTSLARRRRPALLRPHPARRRHGRRGAGARRRRCSTPCCRSPSAASPSSASSRRAC